MKNIMKKAWEIYKTLVGDHIAKIKLALKLAWKKLRIEDIKMKKIDEIMEKLKEIVAQERTDIGYNYKIVATDWEKYEKNRTYIKVVETRDCSSHYKVYDFGYVDNINNEYVANRNNDATKRYTLGGMNF